MPCRAVPCRAVELAVFWVSLCKPPSSTCYSLTFPHVCTPSPPATASLIHLLQPPSSTCYSLSFRPLVHRVPAVAAAAAAAAWRGCPAEVGLHGECFLALGYELQPVDLIWSLLCVEAVPASNLLMLTDPCFTRCSHRTLYVLYVYTSCNTLYCLKLYIISMNHI